jgi:hypothetical protein
MRGGELVGGRFEILGPGVAGGSGIVCRARDHATGGDVALKRLRAVGDGARFAREASVLATLDHPAVVRYVAHGTTEGGERYLAMEWLEGQDLAERLRQGPLDAIEAATLAATIAEALATAHDRGAVHRDLKPSNVFLVGGRTDRPKLIDFGVAHLLADAGQTAAGQIVGTPAYMSPEQARGEPVDARSDLFALGCVLFECIAGRPPWTGGSDVAVMAKLMLDDAPRLADLRALAPAALERVIARLLEKDRSRRHASAAALALELRSIAHAGGAPEPDTAPALTRRESRLACVILAGGVPGEIAAPIAAAEGAQAEVLLGGTVAASLSDAGSAMDLAARAARLALRLAAAAPGGRVALATGRAEIAGALPTGDAIERAAALFAAAPPQPPGVRIDAATASLLDDGFAIARDGASAIATGETGSRNPLRRLLGKPTPCVGRDRELAALSAAFRACVEAKAARAMLITGPAGAGKSRLRHELLAGLAARGSAEVWMARGDPMRRGSPYGVLAQAIRGAVGVGEAEPAEHGRARIRERTAAAPGPEEAARMAEFLGEIVGLRFPDADRLELRAARQDPMLMADQTRRAWEELVVLAAAARPVVLVLEDLQWADLPTLKLVDAALRHARDRAFFVLGLARPEVDEIFPGLWADRPVSRLALGELPAEAARDLVRSVLGSEVPDAVAARIVEQAGGNAFCLEELIRATAEGHGAPRAPGSVLAMAAARLETLPEELRLALRAGSVFGETFRLEGAAALLGLPLDDARPLLDALVARELLVERSARAYAFRHAIVREAAYGMLTDEDRALGHRLAAEWLARAAESDAFVLAQHLERGGARAAAVPAYARAAEQALDASDLDAVLDRTAAAARCGARGEALAQLRLLEAIARHWRAEYAEGERAATEAIEELMPLSPPWYRAVEEVAESSLPLGHVDTLLALGEALSPPPGAGAPPRAFLTAAATLAMQLFLGGQYDAAQAVMARLEGGEARLEVAAPLVSARSHFARATRALVAGDLGGVLESARAAVSDFDRAGDQRNAALMRSNLAFAYLEIGAYAEAEAPLLRAIAAGERLGLPQVVAAAKGNLGWALARGGRLREARAILDESVALAVANGDARMEGVSRIYLAQTLALAGDLAAARDHAARAVAALADTPPVRAHALGALARVLLAEGRTSEARAAAEEAAAALAALGSIEEGEALVRLAHAEALAASGAADEARRALAAAREAVLARAAKIRDAAWRERFLREVPENARTLELAAATLDITA